MYFYIFVIGQFTSVSPLNGNMNLPTKRLASLFPTKSDTKHNPNPVPAAPFPPFREKLHPFLATILPSVRFCPLPPPPTPLAVADFPFSFPWTNCLHHWLLGALKYSRRFSSLSHTLPVIPPWYFSPPLTVTL